VQHGECSGWSSPRSPQSRVVTLSLMRPGFNATRRNRNIGTAKQGHGQNNTLRVASPLAVTGIFWEQLGEYQMVKKECGGRDFPIFIEETREDCVHACSADDVASVLRHTRAKDYASLTAVVLRQPKRKEQILHSVWGRMVYYANVGRPQSGSVAGPVVILEASTPERIWWRSKSMGPADAEELDRLAADGHQITPTRS